VVSNFAPRGTVLASSYEAKARGIRTGTKIQEARVLCPGIRLVRTSPGAYKATHHQFMDILRDLFGPEVQVRSIDEVAMFLPPNWQEREFVLGLARRIKERFRKELGECIRCSIGIAPNSLLAKVAGDLQKPDGLTEITLENLPATLARLELVDLPGISFRNAARLSARGITTPLELYRADPDRLAALFGIWGRQWWWRLHGYESDGSWSQGGMKSMSHEHVLEKWVSRRDDLLPLADKMADRLVHRLRHNGLQCRGIGLSVSLVGYPRFQRWSRLDAPTASYQLLMQRFRHLAEDIPVRLPVPARKIAVFFGDLSPGDNGYQPDLFEVLSRQEAVSAALEGLRERYGFESVTLGSVLAARQELREEIGFGRLKDRR
jgi:DNA polymerase-4